MINRTTLQFSLAWRLILLLVIVSIAVVAGLRWYVCQISAGYESDLADTVLLEFFADIVWALPAIGITTVAMGIWAIRSGLAPLRALSAEISRVAPGSRPACFADGIRLLGNLVVLGGLRLEVIERLQRLAHRRRLQHPW